MASAGADSKDLPVQQYDGVPSTQGRAGKPTIPEKDFGSGILDSVYQPQMFQAVGKLFQQESYADIMLVAEGHSIPCHRVLLAAASEYFHHKMTASMEGNSENHNLLEIEDIKFQTLQLVVSYLYTGYISITIDNAGEVIAASKLLKLGSLLQRCEAHLMLAADTKNCITLFRIGNVHGMANLTQKGSQLMVENFSDVVTSDNFMEMAEDEVLAYIQSHYLCLPNENEVFGAVVAWIKHAPEKRKGCMERLVQHIRLPYCTESYLKHVVARESLMKSPIPSQHLVQALSLATTCSSRGGGLKVHPTDCYHCSTVPRVSFMETTMVCIGGTDSTGTCAKSWYLLNNTWLELKAMQSPPFCFSACVVNGGVVITGGAGYNGQPVTDTWLLSDATGNWSVLANMSTARYRHASVCVGGQLYVLGGEGCNQDLLHSVECLDEIDEEWREMQQMPTGLMHPMAVSYGQYIYMFGGCDMDQHYGCSFEFNSQANRWKKLADMPSCCTFGSAVVYKERIFVIGGFEQCCMTFDPTQNQWTTLSQCLRQHAGAPALVWEGRIVVCGGRSARPEDLDDEGKAMATAVVEEYDPQTDTWCVSQLELPLKLFSHAAFNVDPLSTLVLENLQADFWDESWHFEME